MTLSEKESNPPYETVQKEMDLNNKAQISNENSFCNVLNGSQYDYIDDTIFSQSQSSQQLSQFSFTQVFGDTNPEPTYLSPKNSSLRSPKPPKTKQRSIFEFAQQVGPPLPENPDLYYSTIEKIYIFFNRQKSIPMILEAIHQSGGNVSEAINVLRRCKNTKKLSEIDFRFQTIRASSEQLEKYFS